MPITSDKDYDARPEESLAARVSQQRWLIAAGACLFLAVIALLLGRMNAAFVVATLGVVAWFWNERNRLSPAGIEAEETLEDEDEENEDRDKE